MSTPRILFRGAEARFPGWETRIFAYRFKYKLFKIILTDRPRGYRIEHFKIFLILILIFGMVPF
jgi:hypothetical protein